MRDTRSAALELTERIARRRWRSSARRDRAAPRRERSRSGAQALATEMADHLRALLRDVICGHLDPDLVGARRRAAAASRASRDRSGAPGVEDRLSSKQMLGDASQSEEILDLLV